MKTKNCKVCRDRKLIEEFYRSPAYDDGFLPICKSCTLEYDRQRVANHPGPRTTGTKVCTKCKEEKSVSEYSKRLRSRDGLRNNCKDCDHRSEKSYRVRNPTSTYLAKCRQRYGIEKHEYLALVEKCDGKCSICKSEEKLVIDHCHETLKIRGLLCAKCNAGLGMFGDNIDNLKDAIGYLNDNSDMVAATSSHSLQ